MIERRKHISLNLGYAVLVSILSASQPAAAIGDGPPDVVKLEETAADDQPEWIVGDALLQEGIEGDPRHYKFYVDSPLHLGGGFNPNDLAKPVTDCVKSKSVEIDGSGALLTSYSQSVVFNASQLKQAISIDAKVDASYLSYKGGATYSFATDSLFSDYSITIVITATVEFGRLMANGSLDPKYAPLLADSRKFESICGSRFVSIERRGSSASAVITIYGLTKEEHDHITAGLSGGGGGGSFSASVSAELSRDIKRASQSNELLVQVVATGGTGFGGLAGLIKSAAPQDDSIGVIKNALAEYLKNFNSTNAAPIGYEIIDMQFVGWKPNQRDLWTDTKERILREIVKNYRVTESSLDDAEGILAGTDPRRAIVPVTDDPIIIKLKKDYAERLKILAEAHEKCKADTTTAGKKCVVPVFSDIVFNPIPPTPLPPVGTYVVSGWTGGDNYVTFDSIKSKAFLNGAYLANIKMRTFFSPEDKRTDFESRFNMVGLRQGSVEYLLSDPNMVFQSLSVKLDGTSDYIDIDTLGDICCVVRFTFDRFNHSQLNLYSRVDSYIYNDMMTLKELGKLDKSATFAVHITNRLGRNFFLPFVSADWHRTIFPRIPGGVGSTEESRVIIKPAI